MRTVLLAFALLATPGAVLTGCGEPAEQIRSKKVTVGCGTCKYQLPNGRGCYWAVELDGKQYPVTGVLPQDHENHSPTGMCNIKRTAVVDGELSGNTFLSTRFDLEPAESGAAEPKYTVEDKHDGSWDASKMGSP